MQKEPTELEIGDGLLVNPTAFQQAGAGPRERPL